MFNRRLLYLSTYRMTAFRWEAGVLVSEALFEATEEGHLAFADYLGVHKKSLFSLLSNASEEGFQIETLPFLSGKDRRAIIKRKLGQLFFDVSLTTSQSLGHEKSQRKNERVLLAALSNNEFYQPWLEALRTSQVALSGIYSLPFLGNVLLEKLKITDERCLLLTVQDQTIRQSYFEKGILHFSRLTPLQNSSISGIAQTFATESHKLQQYLTSQRMIGRNQVITVHILAHASAQQAIESSCTSTGTLQFRFLKLEECAKKLGLSAQPASSYCETLFLHLLATAAPRTQFADDDQRHFYHLWLLRFALYGAGALTLLCCLLFAGKHALDIWGIHQETAQFATEANHARQRYSAIAQTFPPIPTSHETLRRVIDRYADLDQSSASPDKLYLTLSRALNTNPALRLDEIDWSTGPLPAAGTHPGTAPPSRSTNNSAPTKSGESHEIAIAHGSLQLGGQATPRQLVATFDRFLAALKSEPKIQVLVLQHPVDFESGKSIKGGDTASDETKSHRFVVQIARKIGS